MATELPEQAEDYSAVLRQQDIAKWKEALESGKWPTISGQILLLEALINTRQALRTLVEAVELLADARIDEEEAAWVELGKAIEQARAALPKTEQEGLT